MQGTFELRPSIATINPADGRLHRLQPVELDPHALAHLGALNELDPASARRGIEHPHTETETAGASQSDLRSKRHAIRAAPGLGIIWVAAHRKTNLATASALAMT